MPRNEWVLVFPMCLLFSTNHAILITISKVTLSFFSVYYLVFLPFVLDLFIRAMEDEDYGLLKPITVLSLFIASKYFARNISRRLLSKCDYYPVISADMLLFYLLCLVFLIAFSTLHIFHFHSFLPESPAFQSSEYQK